VQSLIQAEILIYSPELLKKISEMQELAAGCEEEIEIRAVTVQAVEMLREVSKINEKCTTTNERVHLFDKKMLHLLQDLRDVGLKLLSVEVDWLLWHMGEEIKDEVKFPFHRCRTHFY
jgi:hypothetical protein